MNKHFKKIACVAALSLMPMMAFADDGVGGDSGNGSGLFLGLDTGYSFSFTNMEDKSVKFTSSSMASGLVNVGVKAGYNFYFMDLLGVRGYLNYTFGFAPDSVLIKTGSTTTTDISNFISTNEVTLNADVLVNFMKTDSVSFGAFVGIGLGYGTMKTTSVNKSVETVSLQASGFLLPINVGLSLTANNHHRFELGFKIPTLGMDITHQDGAKLVLTKDQSATFKNFTTTVGYSYIF